MPRLLALLDVEAPGVQVQIKPLPVDTEGMRSRAATSI